MQERFRTSFSMSIDQPRSSDAGTNTKGNASIKAFESPEKLSEVLNIDINLINHFKTILTALNSQLPIDPSKFKALCLNTLLKYIIRKMVGLRCLQWYIKY